MGLNKKNLIFLIGFMASGKSTIGKLLSEELGYQYLDTDETLEKREKMPIHEIFKKRGEDYFRKVERDVLMDLGGNLKHNGTVISTGGGLPCNPENLTFMKAKGIIIYLKSSIQDIIKRIKNIEERPVFHRLMGNNNRGKSLEGLLKNREFYYNQADFIFKNTNKRDPLKLTRQIAKKLRKSYGI